MEILLQVSAQTSHFPVTAVSVLIVGLIAVIGVASFTWAKSNRPMDNTDSVNRQTVDDSPQEKKEKSANYDRNIISAETAARMEREGEDFKEIPESDGGYTVSREGLVNNYAIEPEMYIEERGDLKEKEEAQKKARAEELKEINSEDGDKGVGII
ncbi:MAG: photosystem II assembly protein Psb35 [Cyanobacterium sp.]